MKSIVGRALITGASAGIGAGLAREFARHGHYLVLVARSADKLEALASELSAAHGIKVVALPMDVAAPGAADALHAAVSARRLQIDILVNNAGVFHTELFVDTPLASHLELLQLNLVTLTALTALFLPAMVERDAGRILNLASTSAFQPVPRIALHAASKSFVLSFSEALDLELKDIGVRVTAVCPGFTDTDMVVKPDGSAMRLPFLPNLTVDEVCRQSFAACMAGLPVYVNGRANQALVTLGRLQPRWLQRWTSDKVAQT